MPIICSRLWGALVLVTAGAGTCQWHGMPCAALNSGAVTRPTGGLACSVQLVSLPLCCATAGGSAPPSVQCNYMRTARRSGWLRLACKFHSSKAVNNASQNLSHLPVSLHPSQRPQAARTAAPATRAGVVEGTRVGRHCTIAAVLYAFKVAVRHCLTPNRAGLAAAVPM